MFGEINCKIFMRRLKINYFYFIVQLPNRTNKYPYYFLRHAVNLQPLVYSSAYTQYCFKAFLAGAYISENSTHFYLQDWPNCGINRD